MTLSILSIGLPCRILTFFPILEIELAIFSVKESKLSIWKHITLINHPRIKRTNLVKILRERHKIFINWAYDPPLHLQPVYKEKYFKNMGSYKKTENLMERHFHLPLHMQISLNDAKHIVNTLIKVAKKMVF